MFIPSMIFFVRWNYPVTTFVGKKPPHVPIDLQSEGNIPVGNFDPSFGVKIPGNRATSRLISTAPGISTVLTSVPQPRSQLSSMHACGF